MENIDYDSCFTRRLYYKKKHKVSYSNNLRRIEIELLAVLNTNYQASFTELYIDELLTRIKWKL